MYIFNSGNYVAYLISLILHYAYVGLLFKHTEYRTDKVTVARSRRLVLSFIVTVANYEYAFYWNFYQDATINFEVKATGIISTAMVADGETPGGYGSLVIPNVNGQFHQHIYGMRLDTMFDGQRNTVSTVDVRPCEGDYGSKTNPFGQGFTVSETPMKSTQDSHSDASTETSRFWKISNPASIHETTGKPVAWKLVPHNAHKLMAKPGSHVFEQAGFAKHTVWVTPYDEKELYPAGFYINQINGYNGMDQWVAGKKKVEDEDIVLWHVFGATHIPRVEDFPIMPTE
jgi:primary-amine oxidase